jgi:hypothetical protein
MASGERANDNGDGFVPQIPSRRQVHSIHIFHTRKQTSSNHSRLSFEITRSAAAACLVYHTRTRARARVGLHLLLPHLSPPPQTTPTRRPPPPRPTFSLRRARAAVNRGNISTRRAPRSNLARVRPGCDQRAPRLRRPFRGKKRGGVETESFAPRREIQPLATAAGGFIARAWMTRPGDANVDVAPAAAAATMAGGPTAAEAAAASSASSASSPSPPPPPAPATDDTTEFRLGPFSSYTLYLIGVSLLLCVLCIVALSKARRWHHQRARDHDAVTTAAVAAAAAAEAAPAAPPAANPPRRGARPEVIAALPKFTWQEKWVGADGGSDGEEEDEEEDSRGDVEAPPSAPRPPPPPPAATPALLRRAAREGCAICLDDFAGGDVVRVLPACGHIYHSECVGDWLRMQARCPMCKAEVVGAEEQGGGGGGGGDAEEAGVAAAAASTAAAEASGRGVPWRPPRRRRLVLFKLVLRRRRSGGEAAAGVRGGGGGDVAAPPPVSGAGRA